MRREIKGVYVEDSGPTGRVDRETGTEPPQVVLLEQIPPRAYRYFERGFVAVL